MDFLCLVIMNTLLYYLDLLEVALRLAPAFTVMVLIGIRASRLSLSRYIIAVRKEAYGCWPLWL
jgi:hypothetical protein